MASGTKDITDDLEEVIVFLPHFKNTETSTEGAKMTVISSSDL